MKKVSFIGVGIMGKWMVRHLMKAGYELNIYARTKSKVEDVISEGAIFHDTIASCVEDGDVVITIVGFPSDVEEVYYKEGNIFDSAKQGAYLLDMTTSSPTLAEKLYADGKAKGFRVLDAPVTGGDMGAKNGTLSIFVGGDKEDFKACLPILEAMGNNINYQGAEGTGQHAKLANQIMIAGALSGACEGLAYAKAKNLNLNTFIKSVATGSAGSNQLNLNGEKIIKGDYSPGFFVKHFIKDMKLAKDESQNENLNLDMLNLILDIYVKLEDNGDGDLGTQALFKHYVG